MEFHILSETPFMKTWASGLHNSMFDIHTLIHEPHIEQSSIVINPLTSVTVI